VILFGALVLAVAQPPKAVLPAFAVRPADPALVGRVLTETEVTRQPPSPSWTGYVGAWNEAIAHWIVEFFKARPEVARGLSIAVEVVGIAIVIAAVGLLGVIVARRMVRPRTARDIPPPGWSRTPAASAARRDRTYWKSEMESRLARGDVAGALDALWWWLAASILPGAPVDPSWTTRELLLKARRPELFSMIGPLDVLMYGRKGASTGAVSACVARLEGMLS